MGVDETLLNEIVRRVLTAVQPDRIILFGSAATGQMTKDSDIDLLIVDPAPRNTRAESVKIRRAVGDVSYPIDVMVIASDRFEATKSVGSSNDWRRPIPSRPSPCQVQIPHSRRRGDALPR